MSKNVIDLNEYKNSQEDIEAMALDIPDELIDAYLNEVEINTPDLWSKIETGYEKELKLIDSENKTRRKKVIGFIAAAVVIVVIAIPIAIFNVAGKKESKSDGTTEAKELSFDYEETDNADESYVEAEATTEASDDLETDSFAYDTQEQYSNSVVSGQENKDSNKTDNVEAACDDSEGDSDDDSEFAKEIVFNEITYVDADEDMVDTLPEEYATEIAVKNEFCSYPEEELTVIWTGNKDEIDYIYVCYNDLYKLYVKKDKAEK